MSQDALNYEPVAYHQAYSQYGYDQSAYGQTTYGYTQATTQAFTSKLDDKEPAQKKRGATTACIACILAAVTAASIAVVFLLQGVGLSSGTEKEGTGGTDVPQLPAVYPVVRITLRPSAIPTTVARTTITPTASTKSPREAMDGQPLICTMGARTRSLSMFPSDGLCEYIFFDSVGKNTRNPLGDPDQWDTDLRTFIETYYQYTTTAFGIAFSFDKVFSLVRQLNTTPSPLEPFWRREIFHFGILDTATLNAREPDVDLALKVLKVLDKHAESMRLLSNPSFIFFAGVVFNNNWLNYYNDRFKSVYKPDLFIAQSHYFHGDNTFRDCRVRPPTVLHRQQNQTSYLPDLSMAGETINELSEQGVQLIWALSVTMKGRFTMTPASQSAPADFYSVCVHNTSAPSFGSYSEICRNPNFLQRRYNPAVDSILAVHDTDHVLFAYDSEMGLCRKLCGVKAQHPTLRFGIAVYDVDYEDFSNTCTGFNKYGAFSRLNAVRRILNYFRTRFNSASDLLGCQGVIP